MEGHAAPRAARMAGLWLPVFALIWVASVTHAAPRLPARMQALQQSARAESLARAVRPGPTWAEATVAVSPAGCTDLIEPDSYPLGSAAFGTAVADFDGDGRPDVAAAVVGDSLRIFPNLGEGRLGAPRVVPAFDRQTVATADLDGDGRPDLVAGGSGTQVWLNAGDGSFVLDSVYASKSTYWLHQVRPAFADMDGDGRPDLLVAHSDSSLTIRLNDGGGRLRRTWRPDLPGRPRQFGVADLDRDGRPDLVLRCYAGWDLVFCVLLNRGDGVFLRRDEPDPGATFALGDFDGDGTTDLVLGGSGDGGGLGFRRGRGDGTFEPPVAGGPTLDTESIEVADMDDDGRADLVGWSNSDRTPVSVMLGDGAGGFRRLSRYQLGVQDRGLTVADLDGDGLPDVVAGNDERRLLVALGRGGGRLTARGSEPVGDFPIAAAAADLDGDGRADLASVTYWSSSLRTLRSRGDGTFETPVPMSNPTFPIAIAAADLTGDGHADLATLSADNPDDFLALQVNQGDGTFRDGQRINLVPLGYLPEALVAADFDRDGAVDLALAGHPAPALLRNFGDGPFREPVLLPAPACHAVASGDFDADGWPDLVTSVFTGRVWVLLNDGHGGFADTVGHACPGAISLAVADLDGDGRDDLAVGSATRAVVSVFLSDPDGALRPAGAIAVPAPNSATVAALLPRPGAPADLVVAAYTSQSEPGTLVRLRNDGAGTFSIACASQAGAAANGLTVGDFDGNGALDLALSSGNDGHKFEYLTVALGARRDPLAVRNLVLLEARAEPDRVRLAWQADGELAAAKLYRSVAAGPWTRVTALVPGAAGRLSFEDTAVTPGARYGYRLGLGWSPAEVVSEAAWVTVPFFGFALAGLRPNPASGDATRVAFVLAGSGAARLQVLDVAGRVVRSRALEGLGPGAHEVALGEGPRLAPGVYLVRLTEGPRSATARAVVIR